jgi:hypothetical protein
MTVAKMSDGNGEPTQSVARSRVYEQSDVRLAAANRGVRCRRRRQRSDGRHVPTHDVINT